MTLKLEDRGPKVKKLQLALAQAGFSPGTIDGIFGLGTEAAVLAFQRSKRLLADGIAGPKTLAALGLKGEVDSDSTLRVFTVNIVSRMFPHTPLDNINTHLPLVLSALQGHDLDEKRMGLVALATIRAESEGFVPISEGISRYNTSPGGHPFDLYDNRADLGNKGKPDGEKFKGRGFVQLTGRANYSTYGEKLGIKDKLIKKPDLANDPNVAADLLAVFLKDKERQIKEALLDDDLKAVRRLVNGGTHGLDRFLHAFDVGEYLVG